jgi:GR25 family glycosyltransferase involved in LPS biosynthesis
MIKYCFYLNLERRTDRKLFIEEQLNKSEILKDKFERFESVDGYKVHPREVESGLLSDNAVEDILMDTVTAWGLSLTQGGLGVLLSYKKLFEKISNLDSPVITFEDDTRIKDNFDYYLEKILTELPNDFDLCYLGYGEVKIETEKYSEHLSKPKGIVTCLPSLIISPSGAKNLLEILKNVDNQIDTTIYTKGKHLNTFVSNEKIVEVKNEFKTDIQGNNGCKKDYIKQNYIISTIAVGDDANRKALKLCYDLNYFKQKLLIVTNRKDLFEKLQNVIIVEYPNKKFSYNDKIICFEEGLKLYDCVVYIDSDSRVFYKNYKNCYTNFLRKIEPGFHPSWDWGKIIRKDSGFFDSTDISSRIGGYGELALLKSKELEIPIENAYHHQEGIVIICKDDGKEKILLDTWKKLSSVLDDYEIKNNVIRVGVGEGNLIGLSIAKSEIKVNTHDVANFVGDNLKYNFCSGGQIGDYIKNYPDRMTVKIGDGTLLKTNMVDVEFDNKSIDLTYEIYQLSDNLMCLTYKWNNKNNVEFLDHEFKINDNVYHFNSEKTGEMVFENRKDIKIYHTYDWYGQRNWKEIDSI